jgi:hypothetical protein
MDDPAQGEEPQNRRQNEHDAGLEAPALDKLAHPGMKKLDNAAMTLPVEP